MVFKNGIIDNFEVRFKSISKDKDRYFDTLIDLSEKGHLKTNQVLNFSAAGSLWIYDQYLEKGLLDIVEKDLRRGVASRDFHGPLFENTQVIFGRLWEMGEVDMVLRLYRAAITHRLKAIISEQAIRDKFDVDTKAHKESARWIKHYYPFLKDMIAEYAERLVEENIKNDDLTQFNSQLETIHP